MNPINWITGMTVIGWLKAMGGALVVLLAVEVVYHMIKGEWL